MSEKSSEKPGDHLPWAFWVGVTLLVLGLFAFVNEGHPGFILLTVLVGVILLATGLIQRSIEKSRRP